MPRDQINFRCDLEMKLYLIQMGDYSKYIRDLINNDRLDNRDTKFINKQIIEYEQKIKELKELKKKPIVDQNKINECLTYWNRVFKNYLFKTKDELKKEIEKKVMPNLKKLHYSGSSDEVAELFLNWPKEG